MVFSPRKSEFSFDTVSFPIGGPFLKFPIFLLSMGFPEDQVNQALLHAHFEVNKPVTYLVKQTCTCEDPVAGTMLSPTSPVTPPDERPLTPPSDTLHTTHPRQTHVVSVSTSSDGNTSGDRQREDRCVVTQLQTVTANSLAQIAPIQETTREPVPTQSVTHTPRQQRTIHSAPPPRQRTRVIPDHEGWTRSDSVITRRYDLLTSDSD